MAQSLQDQLLKAGLVTEKQAKDSRRKDVKGRKSAKKPKKARPPQARPAVAGADTPATPVSEREREVARQRAAKIARDRALNQDREAERQRKAKRAQVRQLIEGNARNDPAADQPYNYQRGKKIKRIQVTAAQRQQLLAGSLAVLVLEGQQYLLETATAERVLALAPDAWMHRHDPQAEAAAPEADADDPYAEFQVPDDLMW